MIQIWSKHLIIFNNETKSVRNSWQFSQYFVVFWFQGVCKILHTKNVSCGGVIDLAVEQQQLYIKLSKNKETTKNKIN